MARVSLDRRTTGTCLASSSALPTLLSLNFGCFAGFGFLPFATRQVKSSSAIRSGSRGTRESISSIRPDSSSRVR